MFAKLPVDHALMKAKSHAKKDEIVDAQTLHKKILQNLPQNKKVHQGLTDLEKIRKQNLNQKPPQEIINKLINLYNQGQLSLVVEYAQVLTREYPETFIFWNLLGKSAARMGMSDQAIIALRKVISMKPDLREAYDNIGVVLQAQGKLDDALYNYKKSISLNPDYPNSYFNMGNTLKDMGKFNEAEEAYKKAILLKPNHPKAYGNMGITLQKQGKLEEAIEAYQKSISFIPNYAETYTNMGNALDEQGKLDEAIGAHKKSISLNPNYPLAYNNMGNVLQKQGKVDEAIEAYEKTILLNPDYLEAHNNMGVALRDQGKLDKAIDAYNKALFLNPNHIETLNNLGGVLREKGELDEAVNVYYKVLSLKPDYAIGYNNLGATLHHQGKIEASLEAYNKSMHIDPDNPSTHENLSRALLQFGRIKEGLEEYEWRQKTEKGLLSHRHFPQPQWDGQVSLKDKTILLWCEQGIGDTMNWSSCLSLLSARANHVILECQQKLVPLLSRSFPNVEVKAEDRSLDPYRDDFDLHLPMGSLYKHFIDDIIKKDKPVSYLIPDPARVKYWKDHMCNVGNGPYIGISWKSSVKSAYRLRHYPPILEWSPILMVPDATFINLQYIDHEDDIAKVQDELGVTIYNFSDIDLYGDIDEVAALMAALDMVVSTKTTPPMISAGVGIPTIIANWRQSYYNTILTNPHSTSLEMKHKDTSETWDKVFNLIAKDILKLKNKKIKNKTALLGI